MSEPPDRPKHLELRASDADREQVAGILHEAVGEGRLTLTELDERLQATYAAKTLGDLVPITADLPVGAHQAPPPQPRPVPRIGGAPGPTTSVAMMSGFVREGDWVVPRYHTAFAFMGGGKLDLTNARFAEATATIQVIAFMGGVEITVPDDITVRVTGFGFMGGFDHRHTSVGPPGSPTLTVTGFAFMGGVDVKPARRGRGRIDR